MTKTFTLIYLKIRTRKRPVRKLGYFPNVFSPEDSKLSANKRYDQNFQCIGNQGYCECKNNCNTGHRISKEITVNNTGLTTWREVDGEEKYWNVSLKLDQNSRAISSPSIPQERIEDITNLITMDISEK